MDDGDGARSPVRRRAPAGNDRPLRAVLVVLAAAAIIAVAVLAAALAPPPASADAPVQVEPAGTVGPTGGNASAEPPAAPSGGSSSRALAWWMAGEVGVLVVGGAIWCRRATRRQAARAAPVPRAAAPANSVVLAGRADRQPAERHPSSRFRL